MKPYRRGIMAFKTGDLSNPYNVGTQRHRDWELGFNAAYFKNLERVKNIERKKGKPRTGGKAVYQT